MNQSLWHWLSIAGYSVLACFILCNSCEAQSRNDDDFKPIPQEIGRQWSEVGAREGWIKNTPPQVASGYEHWETPLEKKRAGAIPSFALLLSKSDSLGKLPDPGVAFGLDLSCSSVRGASLKILGKMKNLRSLNIGGSQVLTDDAAAELVELKDLQALYLFHTLLTDKAVMKIVRLKRLHVLDLSYTRVTNAGVKHLATLDGLQALNLGETSVSDSGLKELAKMESLRWLNLRRTKVTSAGVEMLRAELKNCKITSGDD